MTPDGTAWDTISVRMGGRTQYALAAELAGRTGMSFESMRKNVSRWRAGKEPSPRYRQLLAEVLGGEPDDYLNRATLHVITTDDGLHDLRAEAVAGLAALREDLQAVVATLEQHDKRIRQLEAARTQRQGRHGRNDA